MKTPYEKRLKYGLPRLLFGKTKKKARLFYAALILLYILGFLIIQSLQLL